MYASPASLHMPRHERAFLVICGLFFGTLGLINLLGVSRFVDFSFTWQGSKIPLILPLGVLTYPVLLVCTNLIAEFYGKQRANFMVWLGLLVNLWILAVLWGAGYLPPEASVEQATQLPVPTHPDYAFYTIRKLTLGSIVGSTIAYLITQILEIYLFQYWKQKTQGKYLWLRYNISAFCSQFIDTCLVVSLTFFLTGKVPAIEGEITFSVWFVILSCYFFKIVVALICLAPFYLIVIYLRHFLGLAKNSYLSIPLIKESEA